MVASHYLSLKSDSNQESRGSDMEEEAAEEKAENRLVRVGGQALERKGEREDDKAKNLAVVLKRDRS